MQQYLVLFNKLVQLTKPNTSYHTETLQSFAEDLGSTDVSPLEAFELLGPRLQLGFVSISRSQLGEVLKDIRFPVILYGSADGEIVLIHPNNKTEHQVISIDRQGNEKLLDQENAAELIANHQGGISYCFPQQPMAGTSSSASLEGKPLKRLWELLSIDRKDVLLIYAYAILGGLLYLSLPLGVQAIITNVSSGRITTSWAVMLAFVLIGVLLTGVMQIMQMSIIESMEQKIFTRSAMQFARKIPLLQFEALGSSYPPELVNRFFDTVNVQKGLSKILMSFSTSSLQILFGLLLLSFYHPFFIVFGLVLLSIILLIFRITGPTGLATSMSESKYKYAVAHWLEEVARSLVSFKLSGGTQLVSKRTDSLVTKYLHYRQAHFRILIFQFSNIIAFKFLVTGGLLILGSVLVVNEKISIGQFIASEIVILQLMAAVEKIIQSMDSIYDVLTALEKIGAVTDLQEDETGGIHFKLIDNEKGIALKLNHLSYRVSEESKKILDDITLDIAAGSKVCISGANGSGKTTLLNILAGLYTRYQGTVCYNGIPAGNINIQSLRAAIGDDLSRETVFEGTILDNITLGRENTNLNAAMAASQLSGFHEFVSSLAEGYNTSVAAEDRRITRSLRNKLMLARALAANPKLLIIDDLLLTVDDEDKEQIIKKLLVNGYQGTLVIASNDAQVASLCDHVLILDKGKLKPE